MDSAFIHQAANELVQNAGTRNIKQIARSCSLDISETYRIKDMLGLLSLYFDMVASDNIALFVHAQAAVGIPIVSKTNIQALLHNKLLKALDMG